MKPSASLRSASSTSRAYVLPLLAAGGGGGGGSRLAVVVPRRSGPAGPPAATLGGKGSVEPPPELAERCSRPGIKVAEAACQDKFGTSSGQVLVKFGSVAPPELAERGSRPGIKAAEAACQDKFGTSSGQVRFSSPAGAGGTRFPARHQGC